MDLKKALPGMAKSTVRQRKKNSLSSTQRFLPMGEIRSDTVLLKNGGFRAVLAVEAINFNLKSETEQQGIISGYESFVNTLYFPLQVLLRSAKMNIDPYLTQLRAIADKQQNELLQRETRSYADFVERLVDVADIMQKRFYVVVPFDHTIRKRTLVEKFFGWLSPDDSSAKAAQRNRDFAEASKQLKDRVNLVQTGLENIGLQSRRFTTHELIELYYQIYNPSTSQEQKIPEDEERLEMEKTVL
ncbi:MAG TPA: TraC family protein [Candidatus Peribacteraceae bacterium]|nr:TraC family protein [Candidatus Peribacteraceae bacterium]